MSVRPAVLQSLVGRARRRLASTLWAGSLEHLRSIPFRDAGHGYDVFGYEPLHAALTLSVLERLHRHWFVESAMDTLLEEDFAVAAKDRLSVLLAMMDQGVIPVFYDPDVEVCKKVIQACANGGAKSRACVMVHSDSPSPWTMTGLPRSDGSSSTSTLA